MTVRFIVDREGNVRRPRIQKGVHELLNEAAIEAVKEQKFRLGRQRGEPVRVELSLPVFFRLR